ncbi:MAG TPA: aminoglycoside phosphotransferase family protein [Streptosporangiales bacterium]
MRLDDVLTIVARETGDDVGVREVRVDHPERLVVEADLGTRHVVIKAAVPDGPMPGGDLAKEIRATDAARAAGVAVPPRMLWHEGPPAVYVAEFVSGHELAADSPDSWWRATGAALRRLHGGAGTDGFPYFGGRDSWWGWLHEWTEYERDRALADGFVTPAAVERLTAVLRRAFADRAEPPPTLLHGDCGPYHWLLRDETVVAALDFGDAGLGDPAFDLATLTLWDRDRLGVVLAGYGAEPAFAAHTRELQLPYHVIRHLAAADWLVDHGFDATPTVVELERIADALG